MLSSRWLSIAVLLALIACYLLTLKPLTPAEKGVFRRFADRLRPGGRVRADERFSVLVSSAREECASLSREEPVRPSAARLHESYLKAGLSEELGLLCREFRLFLELGGVLDGADAIVGISTLGAISRGALNLKLDALHLKSELAAIDWAGKITKKGRSYRMLRMDFHRNPRSGERLSPEEAVAMLGAPGPVNAPSANAALKGARDGGHNKKRVEAIEVLADQRNQAALPVLRNLLEDGSDRVKLAASSALGAIGAEEDIDRLLESGRWPLFRAALEGRAGSGRCLSETRLRGLLKNGNVFIRQAAAYGLYFGDGPDCFQAALALVRDRQWWGGLQDDSQKAVIGRVLMEPGPSTLREVRALLDIEAPGVRVPVLSWIAVNSPGQETLERLRALADEGPVETRRHAKKAYAMAVLSSLAERREPGGQK